MILETRVIIVKAVGTAALTSNPGHAPALRQWGAHRDCYNGAVTGRDAAIMRYRILRMKAARGGRDGLKGVMATALAMTWFASAHAGETLELRSLAASCAACHGTDGHSQGGASLPSLAHLPQAYFLARMRAFRDDDALAANVMAQIAKGYDEQQLQQLAGYFARQPKARY